MQNDNHDNNDSLNPFSPQYPAQPEYFADRNEELKDFRETALNSARLKIPSPMNYAILGTWGQGKTSLLYKFREMSIKELQKQIQCACIYFPLSPHSCRDWETFTSDFLRNAKSNITSAKGIKKKIGSEVSKWELSLNLGVIGASRKTTQEVPRMVESLQTLWEKHLKPSGIQIAFILLDDLHYFPLQAEESAYLTLRTAFQELVNRKCNYSLIITAPTLLFSEIAELAEPVSRFFKRMDLQSFTFEQAKEVIEIRLKSVGSKLVVDNEAIESIIQKTKGHPYLLVFVMHELLNTLRSVRRIDLSSFNKAWKKIEESLGKAIFAQKFQTASQTERKLMIGIAKSGSDLVSPIEFKKFKGASRLFSRLEGKELLIRHERGKYSLFHPLFKEYLKRQ